MLWSWSKSKWSCTLTFQKDVTIKFMCPTSGKLPPSLPSRAVQTELRKLRVQMLVTISMKDDNLLIEPLIYIYHWRIGQSNPCLHDQITRTVYLYITKYCTRAYCIQAALCYCISVILIMHRWCVWTISDNACPCPKAMQEVKQFIHNKSQSKADRRWRKCMAQTKAECAVANMQQNTRNVDQETNFCAWLEKILLQKHYLADLVDFGWS